MKHKTRFKFWLALALVGVATAGPPAARAAINIVPNPGFEQGCGTQSPVPCDWVGAALSQDTSTPHSGVASGLLLTFFSGGASATSSCVIVGPGPHAASFWYRSSDSDLSAVDLEAVFFTQPDCTGSNGFDQVLAQPLLLDGSWQESSGVLVAPAGTVAVVFAVDAECAQFDCPVASAGFDDLWVDGAVAATPAIASFSPRSGPAGTQVDILGWNLTGATSVTVNGTAASYTVVSDSEIHATVPAGATSGPISVTTGHGTATGAYAFVISPPPVVSVFTPAGGPAGTSVDISGSDFTGATSVAFNGTSAGFTVRGDGWITAIVPSAAATGPISVTTPSGTGTSSSLFVVGADTTPPPTISSFSPTSGRIGTTVDILGAHFTGATAVGFMGTLADFTVISDAEIHAVVPAAAETGQVSVFTPVGGIVSTGLFTVLPNAPPLATFAISCTALNCTFDGSGSTDSDGSVTAYSWDFGDGNHGAGANVSHTYALTGSETVTLTVTDNDGATATASKAVTLISLTARGYRQNGIRKVTLTWTNTSGASVDVYRNGTSIAIVQTSTFTDTPTRASVSPATYTYRVCAHASAVCSNDATVSF